MDRQQAGEIRLEKVPLKNQSLEPLNPRILDPFLPTNWKKNHKYFMRGGLKRKKAGLILKGPPLNFGP